FLFATPDCGAMYIIGKHMNRCCVGHIPSSGADPDTPVRNQQMLPNDETTGMALIDADRRKAFITLRSVLVYLRKALVTSPLHIRSEPIWIDLMGFALTKRSPLRAVFSWM